MAAPYVTGAAALYLAANPGTQPSALREMLVRTADLGTAYAGVTASGGRLNVNRLFNKDMNVPTPTPPDIAPAVPPVTEEPEEQVEQFKLLRPKPNTSFSIKANRTSRRVSFKWSRIEDVREYRLYLRGKRVKKGKCYRSNKSKQSKKRSRTCYRLKKTLRDSDGTGPVLAKRNASLRLKVGKYRYLVVAVTNDGDKTRGHYIPKKEERVVASVNFRVVRSNTSKRR